MKRDTTKMASQKPRKLTLNKETLRGLNKEQLVTAAGAGSANGLSCISNSCVDTACCTGQTQ
jgi:hypothetical protein